jgi:para-aminobenzoate synthetase
MLFWNGKRRLVRVSPIGPCRWTRWTSRVRPFFRVQRTTFPAKSPHTPPTSPLHSLLCVIHLFYGLLCSLHRAIHAWNQQIHSLLYKITPFWSIQPTAGCKFPHQRWEYTLTRSLESAPVIVCNKDTQRREMPSFAFGSTSSSPSSPERRSRILFIDAYDSFAHSIVALVEESLPVSVTCIKIDDAHYLHNDAAFIAFLRDFEAVIAGPGPGSANNPSDTGIIGKLWHLPNEHQLPVLGVCLGFQSLCTAFGASVSQLSQPKHGIVTEVLHKGRSIFKGLGGIKATQYHSLCVDIQHPIQSGSIAYPGQLWVPSESCPDLEPLAWDCDDLQNGAVLMAVRHTSRPLYGVQYHLGSVYTNDQGTGIFQNWWQEVKDYNTSHQSTQQGSLTMVPRRNRYPLTRETMTDYFSNYQRWMNPYDSQHVNSSGSGREALSPKQLIHLLKDTSELFDNTSVNVDVLTCGSGRILVEDICNLLRIPDNESIVLQSGIGTDFQPNAAGTGRYSIIGLFVPGKTRRLEYRVNGKMLTIHDASGQEIASTRVENFWAYLKDAMELLKPESGPPGASWAPFWGGLMGFVGYEAGLPTIGVELPRDDSEPDLAFAYIERSIVIDHAVKKIYIQSIRPGDENWLRDMSLIIQDAVRMEKRIIWNLEATSNTTAEKTREMASQFDLPIDGEWTAHQLLQCYLKDARFLSSSEGAYCDRIKQCQLAIRTGECYELCLTDQIHVHPRLDHERLSPSIPWLLYNRLMERNSAPFSAYVRFGAKGKGVTIVSSSSERFMSWDRQSVVQCRPINGTVYKTPTVAPDSTASKLINNPMVNTTPDLTNTHDSLSQASAEPLQHRQAITREYAERMLLASKERAQNLMFTDLTRHQLYSVYGPGSVRVPQLLQVEEHATCFQLVSVIEAVPPGIHRPSRPDEWMDPPNAPTTPSPPRSVPPTPHLTWKVDGSPIHPGLVRHATAHHGYLTAPTSGISTPRSASGASTPMRPLPQCPATDKRGIDVLAVSLPPGNMIGAPKKRSCELLAQIESTYGIESRTTQSSGTTKIFKLGDEEAPTMETDSGSCAARDATPIRRGIHCGILGYLDVGGGADFSVVVHTAVKRDKDAHWSISSGDAVTVTSDPCEEWKKRETLVESVLAAFRV